MRSILFLPLDKIERVPKALASNSDKVIFDLEDGLAKDKKDFYAFFKEHDRRRTTRFLNTFPEMEEFWTECRNAYE